MKIQFGFVLLLMLTVLASCQKDDSTKSYLNGTWKINSLVIDGIDKTSLVSQYTIIFNENGMMTMYDSMVTYNCSWSGNSGMMDSAMMGSGGMMGSGMTDCSGMMEYHFNMVGCPDDSPMHELDEDWVMDSYTNNSMLLHQKNSSNSILAMKRM